MYKSKKNIVSKDFQTLKKYLINFLENHKYIYSKAFKNRKIFLSKLPNAIICRKSSAKKRLTCFEVSINILKHAKKYNINSKNKHEYSIRGKDRNGKIIEIHIREESDKKDKKLFFISCYPK